MGQGLEPHGRLGGLELVEMARLRPYSDTATCGMPIGTGGR